MAQDEKAVAKAEPKRVTKAAEPTAAGNPVDSSSVSKGRVNSESSAGKTQAIHIPVAIAIIVALSSIYYAQRFPDKADSVFQTTKTLLSNMSLSGPKPMTTTGSTVTIGSSGRQQETRPHPTGRRNIAVPTAQLVGDGANQNELPYYRPNILTDSVIPPVTPPHGQDRIGLFLYPNGFSENPSPVLVPREQLCYSHDTIMSTLSRLAPPEYGCNENGHCRVFLHNGWEVSSCDELQENDKLWLVRPGKEFMWPTFEVGHLVEVRHVSTANRQPIIIETLSKSPKVFKLNNFFDVTEADTLIENALGLTDPNNKLKRSTTGQGEAAQQDPHRTSENAWDMTSPVALKLKRRIFELLGIRPYMDNWADGIQTLRYNLTQAYNSHHDYLDFQPGSRLDTAKGGANRYATVVVYLSDVEEGGETCFPEGERLGAPVSEATARADLKRIAEEEGLDIKPGSWQERLIVQCRTRPAVKPRKAEAVLFYSQHPDGRLDEAALHGGCPVLRGTKWASNLWVWNGPVHGDDTQDAKAAHPPQERSVIAEFGATVPGYSLYWKDTFFGKLEPGMPIRMNTFPGHEFRVFEGDDEERGGLVETFEISEDDGDEQHFLFEGA